ncbi:LysR family transcriptional regulator [Gallaecimonas kandeliae]|uniref:LysR family transcriptional regulator n=1 Tax=Gallaecimonas kandeliae TaxID=3029055 RepID=UPI0026477FBB|nr:LysR family transcriptional regulator [Gallaecimonas kandeliae]WKE64295.1 LysR family transcriptional regulator [Gallaecimonas kandeliae]
MGGGMGWEQYRTFLAVLNEGSLSGAARALGITQPTVGRHISALEASFQQVLFTRSQTGLLPTEAALALRGYAEAMQSNAAALERAASRRQGEGLTGTVRVSASEVIGVEVLPGAIARLRQDHPGLKVELVPTNKVQDLLQREADIAVRMTAPRQEALVARKAGDVEIGLFARSDYLEMHGTPALPDELAGHALVGFDTQTPFLRAATQAFPLWRRDAFSVRTDSDLGQLALIRAGAGIGVCQVALARRDAALKRVLAEHFSFRLPAWITMHQDLRDSPRCRATFDALVACLQAHTATA